MLKKKQIQRKSEVRYGAPPTIGAMACSAHHLAMVARIAALLHVPPAQMRSIMASACAAAQDVSPEHPDVRVLRVAWDTSMRYTQEEKKKNARNSEDVSLFAIPEKDVRVMAALRIADRVPYETLAAVWRGYTQERIAQEIGKACHKLYCLSDKKAHGAQSDFVQVLRMADAQISAAQLSHMRSDLAKHAAVVWAFYERLRESGARIGVDAVPQENAVLCKSESNSVPLQKNVAQQVAQQEESPGGHGETAKEEKPRNSAVRTVVIFLGMIVLTIALVFVALFILAQFSTTPPDAQKKEIQAQSSDTAPVAKRDSEESLPESRSPREVIASLRNHVQSVENDSVQSVVTIDEAFLALQEDGRSVQERIGSTAL